MPELNKKEKGHFRRNWLYYTLFLIAIGLSGFLWVSKNMALKKQAKAFDSEKSMLVKQFDETLLTNSNKNLELMMKTFVWAVRSEMTRDNQEQVDQYFTQLVKSDKIVEITLIDKTGKVLISTNKKNEGVMLATAYTDEVLKVEEVSILNKSEQQVIAAPVLSIDSKIGTLIVLYKTDAFHLDAIKELN